MGNKEIERKFLITDQSLKLHGIDDAIVPIPRKHILQGYLMSDGKTFVRLRRETLTDNSNVVWSDAYYLTVKGPGSPSRPEHETIMPKACFTEMWPAFESITIEKKRYELHDDNNTPIFLDTYDFYLAKSVHVIAEVEFRTLEECYAYVPLKWFGREVTHDKKYSNYQLAYNIYKSKKTK